MKRNSFVVENESDSLKPLCPKPAGSSTQPSRGVSATDTWDKTRGKQLPLCLFLSFFFFLSFPTGVVTSK